MGKITQKQMITYHSLVSLLFTKLIGAITALYDRCDVFLLLIDTWLTGVIVDQPLAEPRDGVVSSRFHLAQLH